MQTLPEVRKLIHPYLRLSEEAIRQHSLALYKSPEMAKLGLRPGPPHRGLSEQTVADPATVAMLVLASIIGGERATLGERTAKLWRATYERPGKTCPITEARDLGGALTNLLADPVRIARLEFIDYVPEVDALTLQGKNEVVSVFHCYGSPKRWAKFKETWLAAPGRLTMFNRLPGSTLQKIADIIGSQGGIAP
jgi:hypothetical protein